MKRHLILVPFLLGLMVACAAPTATPFNLAGTKWALENITQNGATQTPVAGTNITLDFGGDGKLSGDSGCNLYSGTFETQGEIIKIGSLLSTERACVEADKMQYESAYLMALQNAQLFERRAGELSITFANGNGKLVFRPR